MQQSTNRGQGCPEALGDPSHHCVALYRTSSRSWLVLSDAGYALTTRSVATIGWGEDGAHDYMVSPRQIHADLHWMHSKIGIGIG